MPSPYWTALALSLAVAGSLPGQAPEPAVEDCDRELPAEHGASARAAYAAGRDLALSGRWSEAEARLVEAARLDPLLAEAHFLLGQGYADTQRPADALQAFLSARAALACRARSGAAQREAALRLDEDIQSVRDAIRTVESRRLQEASVPWRELNGQRASSLGGSAPLLQRLEVALAELQRRKKRGAGPPPELGLALGSAYFNTGALADAEREYRAALQLEPRLGEAHNNLAVVLMLTGRPEEAEREVKLAERAGLSVAPRLKDEIRKRKQGPPPP